MNIEILRALQPITEEERALLNGKPFDRTLYMSGVQPVVNAQKLLKAGKLITIRPHTRFVQIPPHRHDYVELVYMCTGSTTHRLNGHELKLNAGELLLLGQSVKQEVLPAGEYDVAVNFILLPGFFDQILRLMGEEETPLRRFVLGSLGRGTDSAGYLHFQVSDLLPVQNLVENMLFTLIHDTPNKRQIYQLTMGLLFALLLNHTDRLADAAPQDALLLKVYRYVEEEYATGNLRDLAARIPCDHCYLSRQIKRRTGRTYTELVQEKRLSQAAFLLRNTHRRVEDIAGAVGYENRSYFHRLFFERFGCMPKAYREGK